MRRSGDAPKQTLRQCLSAPCLRPSAASRPSCVRLRRATFRLVCSLLRGVEQVVALVQAHRLSLASLTISCAPSARLHQRSRDANPYRWSMSRAVSTVVPTSSPSARNTPVVVVAPRCHEHCAFGVGWQRLEAYSSCCGAARHDRLVPRERRFVQNTALPSASPVESRPTAYSRPPRVTPITIPEAAVARTAPRSARQVRAWTE